MGTLIRSVFADLVPFFLGLALTPAAIATTILLLGTTEEPVADAVAFAAPFAILYALLGAMVLVTASAVAEPVFSDHDKAVASVVVGLFLILLGAALIVRRRRKPEGGRARKSLVSHVDDVHPPLAFAIGLTMALLNPNIPILFGGLAVVGAADTSTVTRALGVAFLIAGAELFMAGPILWYVARPERAAADLDRVKGWLLRHQLAMNLVVLFGFGGLFAATGWARL